LNTTPQSLPIGDAVGFGWDTFKKWTALLVGLTIAISFVEGMMRFIDDHLIADTYGGRMDFPWFVAVALVNATLQLGMYNVSLKLRDHGSAEFADVFNIFNRVPFYIIALIMQLVVVSIGLVFLVIPGVYLAVRFQFVSYRILEGDNPIEAFQHSWEITQDHVLELILFDLLLLGILIAGVIAFLVGTLVAVPLVGLAMADMYRFLAPRAVAATVTPAPQV